MNKKALVFVIATSILAILLFYLNARIVAMILNYLSSAYEMPPLSVLLLPEVIAFDVLLIIFGAKFVYKISEKIAPKEGSDQRYVVGGAVTIILAVIFLFFWFVTSYDYLRCYYHVDKSIVIEYILAIFSVTIPTIIYGIVLMKKK